MPSFSSPVRVVLRVRTTHRHGVQAVYDRIKRIDKDGDGKLSKDEVFHVPTAKELASYRDHLRKYFDSDDFQYKPRDERKTKQKASAAK